MNKSYLTCLKQFFFLTVFISHFSFSQELKILTIKDFNLKGNVKHCIVSAEYGNEEFYFNKKGLVTKNITRYSEEDYSVTTYQYNEGNLIKKNVDVYIGGVLDKNTSLAHFYEIKLTSKKTIIEKIVNLDGEFIDNYTYDFDKDKRLTKLVIKNDKGISETDVHYKKNKDIESEEIHLVGVDTVKVIKRFSPKIKHNEGDYEQISSMYVNNKPDRAELKFIDSIGRVIYEEKLKAGIKNPYRYYSVSKKTYKYNDNGDVVEEMDFKKKVLLKKSVYEYEYESIDADSEVVNWVRRVEKYSEDFVTREFQYY